MTTEQRYFIPPLGGLYDKVSDLAVPLVRVTAGLLLLPHGAQKLFGRFGGGGLEGTAGFFGKIGLEPASFWALVVGCDEFIGGALLALGLFTRPLAAAVTIQMIYLVVLVHLNNGLIWNNGGIEYPLMWGLVAFAFVLRGGGAYSIDARIGREF